MIAQLRGILLHKASDHAVVDVGGVGYHVIISLTSFNELAETGSEVSLYTYTYVREDQITLFGFVESDEKAIFQRLISVSGIGPKLAMTMLSGLKPHEVVDAVIREDLARINAIQGIGRKTAERIVVELKDKFLKEFAGGISPKASLSLRPTYNDAISALVNLGYTRNLIEKAVARLELPADATVQAIVKHTLKELSKTI